MREIDAFEAKNNLGTLLDRVVGGEEVLRLAQEHGEALPPTQAIVYAVFTTV